MSERFVASPWAFGLAVLGLLLMPLLMGAAMVAYGAGGFLLLYGSVGAGSAVLLFGASVLILALTLTRVCLWARNGRKLLVRSQRITLGAAFMLVIAPLTAWLLCHEWPGFPKAYWSVAGVLALYGLWLVVDAVEDRWSL